MKIQHFKDVEAQLVMNGNIEKRILIGAADKAPNFTMRLFTLKPGASTPYHTHEWEHEVFVIEGKIKVRSKNGEQTIEAGGFVFVEPNEEHQFVNVNDGSSSFICVVPNYGEK